MSKNHVETAAPAVRPRRSRAAPVPTASSSHIRQRSAQLLRGPEERVLGGLFRGMQNLAHGTQLQTVVMLQLKDHALARCQFFQRTGDTCAQLTAHQIALRICAGAAVGYL